MNRLLILPLLVLPALLVSGCTLTPVEVTGNGVEIESLSADFDNIFEGEQVTFRMTVRNTGSADTQEVFAELLGIDQEWGPNPGQEVLPNEEECRYGSDSHFSLLAPEPENGIPGQSHICTWTYIAPDLPDGASITYEVTGRVFYRYSSSTLTSVTFGTYDELVALQNSGQPLPAETTSSSKGPIKITIESQGPIRFSEGESTVEFPLYITIENLGGGVVCKADDPNECKDYMGTDPQNKVSISFSANDINLDDCEISEMSVWAGLPNYHSCEAIATNMPQIISQRIITATAAYSYYSDKTTTVTVTGT